MDRVTRPPRRPPPPEPPRGPYAPYAPVVAVERVFAYERERGLREPFGSEGLVRAGVAPSMTARTLRAIAFLGLIDEDGYRTEDLDRLRKARTDEVPGLLQASVGRAYADILKHIDLATATDGEMAEAFRGYEPTAQRHRMIALFRGLCQLAGMLPLDRRPTTRPRRVSVESARPTHAAADPKTTLLRTLLDALPRHGQWTRGDRDRWLQAWTATVDLVITVEDESPPVAGAMPGTVDGGRLDNREG